MSYMLSGSKLKAHSSTFSQGRKQNPKTMEAAKQ